MIIPLVQYGYTYLKRSMVSGQYHDPQGIFYGGQSLQPSIYQLMTFVTQERPDLFYGDPFATTTTHNDDETNDVDEQQPKIDSLLPPSVVWIDVHSGLGPFGKDSLHCEVAVSQQQQRQDDDDNNNDDDDETAKDESIDIPSIFPTAYRSTIAFGSAHDPTDAFSGYDLASGSMTLMLKEMWESKVSQQQKQQDQQHQDQQSSPPSGLFVVQEFGTLPGILVGRSLILDNMYYQQLLRQANVDDDTDRMGPIKLSYRSPWLRHAFYPQSTEWRQSVIQRGVSVV